MSVRLPPPVHPAGVAPVLDQMGDVGVAQAVRVKFDGQPEGLGVLAEPDVHVVAGHPTATFGGPQRRRRGERVKRTHALDVLGNASVDQTIVASTDRRRGGLPLTALP